MKRALSVLVALVLLSPLFGQDEPLALKGDVATLQRDKHIIIKEDYEVVKSFPFTLEAPKGNLFYQWTIPAGVISQKKANTLVVQAAPKGEFTITAEWAVIDWDKRTVEQKFGSRTFTIGDGTAPAPNPNPTPPPTPTPTPPPTPNPSPAPVVYYFLIVRPDGPASAEFSKVMADPAWQDLVKAGHSYKDKTKTDSKAILGVDIPASVPLPTVFRLRISDDRKTSTVIGSPVPLPTTADGIRKLGEAP